MMCGSHMSVWPAGTPAACLVCRGGEVATGGGAVTGAFMAAFSRLRSSPAFQLAEEARASNSSIDGGRAELLSATSSPGAARGASSPTHCPAWLSENRRTPAIVPRPPLPVGRHAPPIAPWPTRQAAAAMRSRAPLLLLLTALVLAAADTDAETDELLVQPAGVTSQLYCAAGRSNSTARGKCTPSCR